MLNLISNIIVAFAVAHAHAVLLKVTRRFYIRVVFFFLSAEALIDQVHENALRQVCKLTHRLEVGPHLLHDLLQQLLYFKKKFLGISQMMHSLVVDTGHID